MQLITRLQVIQFVVSLRMIEWTLRSQPLERPKRDPHQSTLYDALNLCCNLRGIGWPWSKGLHIPPETRPMHSRAAFVRSTALRALRDIVVCDALQATLQHLGPDSFGSLHGGTIFDARLALPQRYLWSSFLSLLTAMGIYFSLNLAYHFATLVAFAISRQDPAAWPPVSRAPWAATSLSDFWGRRWHQVFRHIFVQFGYKPARAVFGPLGGVLGAFLLSGIMHDICIWPMARGTDFGKIGGFFVLSGVGVVVEQAYERVTSRKVQGFAGWLWAMSFLLATGNLLVDAWLTRGLIGSVVFPEPIRPTRLLVQLWRCLRTSSS